MREKKLSFQANYWIVCPMFAKNREEEWTKRSFN